MILILYITAWTGRFCEEDRNGCSEVTCYPGVVCIDVAAPGVGAQCDSCPSGFTGNGIKCTGVLETSFESFFFCSDRASHVHCIIFIDLVGGSE